LVPNAAEVACFGDVIPGVNIAAVPICLGGLAV
jgi:hypothetical protein